MLKIGPQVDQIQTWPTICWEENEISGLEYWINRRKVEELTGSQFFKFFFHSISSSLGRFNLETSPESHHLYSEPPETDWRLEGKLYLEWIHPEPGRALSLRCITSNRSINGSQITEGNTLRTDRFLSPSLGDQVEGVWGDPKFPLCKLCAKLIEFI